MNELYSDSTEKNIPGAHLIDHKLQVQEATELRLTSLCSP